MLPNQEAEKNYWAQLKQGQSKALTILFENYNDVLFRFGMLIHADREVVKDVIQDLFLDLWNRRERLPDVVQIRSYLLMAFRRILLRKLVKERRTSENLANLPTFEMESQLDHWIQNEIEQERVRVLKAKLTELPTRQKEAIFLRYYENLEYLEISEIMCLNYQVTRNLVYRGLKKLKHLLSDEKWLMPLFLILVQF